MGNEQDGPPLAFKLFQNCKKLENFVRGQYRGRFVKNHNPGLPVKDFQNFHPLLQTDGQVFNLFLRIDIEVVAVGQLPDSGNASFVVKHGSCFGFQSEDHIFDNGEFLYQHKVLVCHADSESDGIVAAANVNASAVD